MGRRAEASVIVWFRQDLRLADNPTWAAAAGSGLPVLPVFIWAPADEGNWTPGSASRWWLRRSLLSLQHDLHRMNLPLVALRTDQAAPVLRQLCLDRSVATVFASSRWEPAAREQERHVEKALAEVGAKLEVVGDQVLFPVAGLRSQSGRVYRSFTPFWKTARQLELPPLLEGRPEQPRAADPRPDQGGVDDLGLLDGAPPGLRPGGAWRPGEAGALAALDEFLTTRLSAYATGRDRPDQDGTSRLSPHLHFGEVSPLRVWNEVQAQVIDAADHGEAAATERSADQFLTQLGWRDFSYYMLLHAARSADESLRPEFSAFPWEYDPAGLAAWKEGRTGYPLVDAGMRQLAAMGWMHNRVRMVVASFLVKDLMVTWQEGARWFWDSLVDADLANNTMGWQWTAGSGADSAPFFRVFNPVTQGRAHDPEGRYVRRWVPELARLSLRWIHAPWRAPAAELRMAGVDIGHTYPLPIVDHSEARATALAAFRSILQRQAER